MIFLLLLFFIAPSNPHEVLEDNSGTVTKSVVFFDKKDADFDVALITRLRKFLDDLESVIKPEPALRSKQSFLESNAVIRDEPPTTTQAASKKNKGIFTGFVHEVNMIVLKMEKNKFVKFIKLLNSEMRKYFSHEAITFHKIVFDPRLVAYMINTLKEWRHKDPGVLRKDLKTMLKNNTKTAFGKFADTINFIFNKKDGKILKKLIKRYYKRTKKNDNLVLNKTISDVLKYLLVQKYISLNFLEKTVLSSAISYLADYVSTFYQAKTMFSNSTISLRKEINDTVINTEDLYPNDEHMENRRSVKADFQLIQNNSLEKILKDSSIETPVKKMDESDIKSGGLGVIQLNQEIEVKVKNTVKNITTTTESRDYDYKYGTPPLRNYTILSVKHNKKRKILGSVEENQRYFRRSFYHDDHDAFLQAIEDNVRSKTADYDFGASSKDSEDKSDDAQQKEDPFYSMRYDKEFERRFFDSQDNFFMERNNRRRYGPGQSIYRKSRKMANSMVERPLNMVTILNPIKRHVH